MTKGHQLLSNPRRIFEDWPEVAAPAPDGATPKPPAPDNAAAKPALHPNDVDDVRPLEDEGIDVPGHEHEATPAGISAHLEPLKQLARKNLALLQHIVALKQAYMEDPQLGSKEAKTEMAAIMSLLFREEESAVYFFGQVLFDPNIGSFISFFDDLGSQKLGPYLGITNLNQIPGKKGDSAAPVPAQPSPVPSATTPPAPPQNAAAPNLPRL